MRPSSWGLAVLLLLLSLIAAAPAAFVDASQGSGATGAGLGRSLPREEVAHRLFARFPIAEPERTGGTVIMGDQGDITTMNAMLADDTVTGAITGLVYESLVALSPVDGTIVPELADSYEIAADGVTYTFRLNPAARWHDGRDLTAEDVAFSYDSLLDPATNSFIRGQLDAAVETYRAVDADTFEVTATDPLATFLYDAVEPVPIMPRHVWAGVDPAGWPSDPGSTGEESARVVGTGPFRFEGRDFSAGTTTGEGFMAPRRPGFVRNEAYWDTIASRVPTIERFIFRVFPDEDAAVQALKVGDTDIFEGIPGARVEEARTWAGLRVDTYDTLDFNYYTLNLDPAWTTLFQQREVRQALFVALDREAIIDAVYGGFGEVAIGTQPRLSPAYAPERMGTAYPFDPARARGLLTDAGWTDADGNGTVEREGRELAFAMFFPADQAGQQLAAYFQEAWSEIGVAMSPELLPFEALTADDGPLLTHDFEAALLGLSWTPDGGQGLLFGCAGYEVGLNLARYCNPEYDRLEALQLREFDPTRRRELLIQQADIVHDDMAIGILRFAVGRTAYHERLHNLYPNDYALLWSLPFVWIGDD